MKKTDIKKSKIGTKLFNAISKNGFMLECPMCENTSFHLLGGFIDEKGEVHSKRTEESLKEAVVIMCNKCFAFKADEKYL